MSEQDARKRLQVGGQAVIEGVMMRSPSCIATAVRTPGGAIVIKKEPFLSFIKRYRFLNIPIVRGAVAFLETFIIAIRALSYSAEQATAEEGAKAVEAGGGEHPREVAGSTGGKNAGKKRVAEKGLSTISILFTLIAALALGFAIFFYLPLRITEWIGLTHGVFFNLVDGLLRLVFLVLYIVLITRWKEMRRIFEYHGAEHKAISAFEEEGAATPENVRAYPTLHPRCSTSFLLLVVVVSIIVFMFLGRPTSIPDKIVRFAFIPVIGGISYELLKLSARPAARRIMGFLVWPGLVLQKLTTKEPAPDQIEVAIAALNACLGDKTVES
jgi:uncharacterized protein YqhQ